MCKKELYFQKYNDFIIAGWSFKGGAKKTGLEKKEHPQRLFSKERELELYTLLSELSFFLNNLLPFPPLVLFFGIYILHKYIFCRLGGGAYFFNI